MKEHRASRASLKNPPKTAVEYLENLAAQGLAQSVAKLKWKPDAL